jgi:hypothetical protein
VSPKLDTNMLEYDEKTEARKLTTYGHRLKNTRDPVRSPIVKLLIAELVLRWVTTRESSVICVGFSVVATHRFPVSDIHGPFP